jgi:hypothetical protein
MIKKLSKQLFPANGVNSYWWNSDTGMTLIWFVGIYLIFCPIVAYIISNCVN